MGRFLAIDWELVGRDLMVSGTARIRTEHIWVYPSRFRRLVANIATCVR